MGRTNIAFLQSPVSGPAGTKCADVTITPSSGDLPLNVQLTTTQTGGHIFYRIVSGITAAAPVHDGDNAVSPTVRIGSNTGQVFIGNSGPQHFTISAVCYQSGFLDSNITYGTYDKPESGQ